MGRVKLRLLPGDEESFKFSFGMREEELGVAAVLEDEAVEQYHELDLRGGQLPIVEHLEQPREVLSAVIEDEVEERVAGGLELLQLHWLARLARDSCVAENTLSLRKEIN